MMMLVDSNVSRFEELEISWSLLADARQERLVAQRPYLYSLVSAINDKDAIMIVIDRNAPWIVELTWLVALLAELGHERAIITREYLYPAVTSIDDEQETSMMVECNASWIGELAVSLAMLIGADRELDSSISIKSIVSHLSTQSTKISTTDQQMNCTTYHRNERHRDEMAKERDKEQRQAPPHCSDLHGGLGLGSGRQFIVRND